jgi:hypothetical protein
MVGLSTDRTKLACFSYVIRGWGEVYGVVESGLLPGMLKT